MKHPWTATVAIAAALLAGPGLAAPVSPDGRTLTAPDGRLRLRFPPSDSQGFDVVFERLVAGQWMKLAEFPPGQNWTVCADWRDRWMAAPVSFKADRVELLDAAHARATGAGLVAGQPWAFADCYSFEHGMVRIDRTWEYQGRGRQSKITLVNRVRISRGDGPRMLIPAVIYNGNAVEIRPSPRLSFEPGEIGLYEEHRLPLPMVNAESAVQGRRQYGSLVAVPSKLAQGNKGNDHWWSLGLEQGKGYTDLLSVSGPLATNGMKSMLYGHRNGFDPYDDAYLNLDGPTTIRKTFYVDVGTDAKKSWAWRETLWKAYEVFRPTETPHIPFAEAARLVTAFTTSTFLRQGEAAGFPTFPGGDHIQYGWTGQAETMALALLCEYARTGAPRQRDMAVGTLNFYVRHSRTAVPGLRYCDHSVKANQWRTSSGWHGVQPSIASRQYGDVLDHLADAAALGGELKIPDAKEWAEALNEGCDFLLRSPRHRGLLPRAWKVDGTPLGWNGGEPPPAAVSAAGVFCISPLVKAARLSGRKQLLDEAQRLMAAYGRAFGEDLLTPPWGTTLDAGGFDVEAPTGFLRANLELYEATGRRLYLDQARDSADLLLTLFYMHEIGFPPGNPLRDALHTIGWTMIGTQNQEIDAYGYFAAPEVYRLGQALNDDRYRALGRVLFEAKTQLIVRPAFRLGNAPEGSQPEYINHTNCTFLPNGRWRGQAHAPGIGWVRGAAMNAITRLHRMDPARFPL